MKNHQNRPEKQLRGRKIQYLRGLAASGKQEKRGNSSTQKRKNMKNRENTRKWVYIAGDYRHERGKASKRTQNRSEASRNHQNRPKIMKIHEIRSERSPRDKSGAFGFETVFWPLGNVGRPEGVSKGSRGAPGGVYARMGIVGLVCHVYASGRSMYICRARIIF